MVLLALMFTGGFKKTAARTVGCTWCFLCCSSLWTETVGNVILYSLLLYTCFINQVTSKSWIRIFIYLCACHLGFLKTFLRIWILDTVFRAICPSVRQTYICTVQLFFFLLIIQIAFVFTAMWLTRIKMYWPIAHLYIE